MRIAFFPLLLILLGAAAGAQTGSAPPRAGQRPDQRIQRIEIEDTGAKIDELRVGGQTQSITVQPKGRMPEYEVLPEDGSRSRSLARDGASGLSGPRVWNVFKF